MNTVRDSYAQYGQDLNVLTFYRGLVGGFFAEVGAFDGIYLSNTYKLEKEFGWMGLCVEPLQDKFELLRKRRKAVCVNQVVSDRSGQEVSFSRPKIGQSFLAGITDKLDGWGKENSIKGEHQTRVTVTLTDILDEQCAPNFVHFLSLDTEGSELAILRGIEFDRYTFGYICVEHNFSEPRRSEMRQLLEQKGYFYYRKNHCDDDYFHRSMIGGTYYYKNDLKRPIRVDLLEDNLIKARSDYWPDEYGIFHPDRLAIDFDNFGRKQVSAYTIESSATNVWRKLPLT